MPIYEYLCPKCQKVFEEWVTLSEAQEKVPCPDCGTGSPRVMSETSFVLKGGGWYVTDYGYRKGVKEEGTKTSSSSASSTSAAKTESTSSSSTAPAATPAATAPAAPAPKAPAAAKA